MATAGDVGSAGDDAVYEATAEAEWNRRMRAVDDDELLRIKGRGSAL